MTTSSSSVRRENNQNKIIQFPFLRRYFCTVIFTIIGSATFSLYISSLENDSIGRVSKWTPVVQKTAISYIRGYPSLNERVGEEMSDVSRKQKKVEKKEKKKMMKKNAEKEEKEPNRTEDKDKGKNKAKNKKVVKEMDNVSDIMKSVKKEKEKVAEKRKRESNKTEENEKEESKAKNEIDKKQKSLEAKSDLQKPNEKKEPIQRIALLGERHSGTNWITSELEKCFPTLEVTSSLIRWKHWFQEDDGNAHINTLVVTQFRNPYEWVEAMRMIPHHSPNHLYLDWKQFVTRPWTMPRTKRDLELENKEGVVCHAKFKYNEVNSCVRGSKEDEEYIQLRKGNTRRTYSGHLPLYELKRDGTGEPFSSILDLRAAKIENFLSVKKWDWIADNILVQYETLVKRGTDFLLKEIEEKVGIKRECEAVPPQTRKSRKLKKKFVEWMTKHVDWEMEKLIGYDRWGKEEGEEIGDEEVDVENEKKSLRETPFKENSHVES